MTEKISRWKRFKKFLKRNMTPLWAKRFSYQVFALLVSIAMVTGVAMYAFTKSYEERTLRLVNGFTITAHTGAFDTPANSVECINACLDGGVDIIEVDVRMRLDGTVVMGHDIITTNNDGTVLEGVLEMIKDKDVRLNLDIKDTRVFPELHRLIDENDMYDQVFMTGIETFQAKAAREECPDVEFYVNYIPSRIRIFSEDYQQKLLKMLERTGAIGINCNHQNASRTLADVLHSNGYKLSVWTVDREFQMKRALIIQPDNITTTKVTLLRDVIRNWKHKE